MKKFYSLLFVLFLASMIRSWGQVSITSTATITENFGTFTSPAAGTNATSANSPANWTLVGSGSTGIQWQGTAQTTGTAGGWYANNNLSFLGSSNATNGNATWLLYNNTGFPLSGFTLSFTAKMWKSGSASPSVTVSYAYSSSNTNPVQGALTNALGSLTFNDATTNIAAVGGTTLTQTVSGITIPNGNYIFIRFVQPGNSNSDNLGWDDVSITPVIANTTTTSAISGSPFCVSPSSAGNFGATVSVPYTTTGTFFGGNTFYAELSDNTGSFASPVQIGTLISTTSGTISATIPSSTAAGTKYRIRIEADNPASGNTYYDNGTDLTVTVLDAPTGFYADHENGGADLYWVNNTASCFSEVMVIASTSPFTSALPTGNGTSYIASLNYASATSSTFDGGKVVYKGTGTIASIISNLTNYTTYYFKIFTRGGPSGTTWVAGATVTTVPQPPVIVISTTSLTGFSYIQGSGPSASSSYTVSGTGLQGDITLTAPTDYEISTDNTTFTNSIVLTEDASNIVASTTIYIRLKAGLSVNSYNSENVSATSPNASTKNLSCSGNVYKQESSNHVTSFAGTCASATSSTIPLTWTNATGAVTPDGYLIKWSTVSYAAIADPVDGTPESGLNEANVSAAAGTYTPSGLYQITTYYFKIYPYTNSGTNINYKTSATIPTTSCTTLDVPCFNEGFNNGISTSGWTFSANIGGTYAFGKTATPSIKMTGGDYIISPTVSAGSAAITISFYLQGQGIGATSSLLVEAYNGSVWTPITTITNIPNSPTWTPYTYSFSSALNYQQFRYTYTKVSGNLAFDDASIYCQYNCISPDAIAFVGQPANVVQSATMSAVTVKAYCTSTGNTATNYTGNITLTASSGACGYVSQTVAAVNGVATFNNIKFTRSTQSNITLQASAGGFTSITSNTFNVTAPAGSPANTTLATNDFQGAGTWGFSIGSPTYTGSGGVNSGDFFNIATISGNKVLSKSYTSDNASGELRSTNTATFNNITGLAAYNYTTFSFQVGSLGAGVGAGNDGGDNMNIDISLDGGTTWNTLLTYYGNSDYLFALSSSPTASLVYNANASYVKPSTQSAFSVILPFSTTQFKFRMKATNNRTDENWVIDNVSLVGTTLGSNSQSFLPTATGNSITTCPSTLTSISIATANTVGTVTYAWTPATNISSTTVANPSVNPAATTTYICNIKDADNCTASANVVVTIPSGSSGSWTGLINSDWFECTNWGNGVVPDNTTDVTVSSSASNPATVDPLSTFASPYSGNAYAKSLTVNNQTLNMMSSSVLYVTNNVNIPASLSGLIDMTNGGNIDIKGNWVNSQGTSGFTAGAGKISFSGSGAQTITTISTAEIFNDLTINNTGSGVTMNNDVTSNGTATFTAGALKISGNTLTIKNATSTSGTLSGSSTSNLTINGAANTLAFTSGSRILKDLLLNTSATVAISASTPLDITAGLAPGSVTVASGATLATNGVLTLKSDINGTSRVGTSAGTISGAATIERYINSAPSGSYTGRAWRLLTGPISSAQSVNSSWQETLTNTTTSGGGQHVGTSNYGTEITNLIATDPASTGYDKAVTNNPSLLYLSGGAWAVPSTTTGMTSTTGNVANGGVSPQQGYMVFIRGDRNVVVTTPPFNTATSTTLRCKGTLNQGAFPYSPGSTGYKLVGNPYASETGLDNFFTNYQLVVGQNYVVWDPKYGGSSGVGGFCTVTWNGGSSYSATAHVSTFNLGSIESSEAFLLNFSTTGSIGFTEADKKSASALIFRPADLITTFTTSLNTIESDGSESLDDGALTIYGSQYSDSVNWLEDAQKISNPGENVAIARFGKLMAIEKRQPIDITDTTFLSISHLKQNTNYEFAFIAGNLNNPNLAARLEDKFTGKVSPLSLTDTTKINFTVTADGASQGANRFRIVFGPPEGGPLPVTYTGIKAWQQNANISVQWNVANELNVKEYTVEKSTDGFTFTAIATVKAAGISLYNYLDTKASEGNNYYRVRTTGSDGSTQYSQLVKVTIGSFAPDMAVYPNPVKSGVIGLQLTNQPKGVYGIRLLSTTGQEIFTKTLLHGGGSSIQTISLKQNLAKGVYQLEVILPNNKGTKLISVVSE